MFIGRSKGFFFAEEEDFGITFAEAQACGTPAIAYGKGGVRETVIPLSDEGDKPSKSGPTGIFFSEQSPGSLIRAIERFEANSGRFDPSIIRKNAERFSKERFRKEFRSFVERTIDDRRP